MPRKTPTKIDPTESALDALLRLLTSKYPARLKPAFTLSYLGDDSEGVKWSRPAPSDPPSGPFYASLARFIAPDEPGGYNYSAGHSGQKYDKRDVVWKTKAPSVGEAVRRAAAFLLKEDEAKLEENLRSALRALAGS